MDNSNIDQLDINEAVRYIADGTRKIVDAMKIRSSDQVSDFKIEVEELSKKSKLEQEKSKQEFNEQKDRIRDRFRRRKH